MADADSLHDGNSDLDNDPQGIDADVEDDEVQDDMCVLFLLIE